MKRLLILCVFWFAVGALCDNAIHLRMTYDGTNVYDTRIRMTGINTNHQFKVDFTTNNVTVSESGDGTNWLSILSTGYDSSDAQGPVRQIYYPDYYGPTFILVTDLVTIPTPSTIAWIKLNH